MIWTVECDHRGPWVTHFPVEALQVAMCFSVISFSPPATRGTTFYRVPFISPEWREDAEQICSRPTGYMEHR